MKTSFKINSLIILFLAFGSCKTESSKSMVEDRKSIEMVTNYGTMIIELYNETPLHRDNFIKLIKKSAYDSILFHRVIEKFMIQGGDLDSRNASTIDTLGRSSLSYKINAEFNPALFHKKGALAAARDNNPERASSSTQFYIVQGKEYNDSLLTNAETRINGWLAEYYFKKNTTNKPLVDSLQKAFDNEKFKQYALLNDSITNLAKAYNNFERYTIPEAHRNVYKTIGGTPHLDQNYTVFGEVIQGLEVVDSIASVQTGQNDRPIYDVIIFSVSILK